MDLQYCTANFFT